LTFIIAAILAQALLNSECGKAAEFTTDNSKIIVVKKGFIATNNPALLSFAKQLGVNHVLEQDRNPICCIWIGPLEIDKKATGDHFVMIHYGYTLVEVTSSKGLKMLSLELKNRGFDDKKGLPQGILTSFRPVK